MKKAILMTFALLCAVVQGAWADPSGNWTDSGNYSTSWETSTDGKTVYINSAADLARLAYCINNNTGLDDFGSGYTFLLTADLDMSAHYWVPIGVSHDKSFKGVFDGQGHTISDINVNRPDNNGIGLFGVVDSERESVVIIRNLKLTISSIKGYGETGGIAGIIRGDVRISNIICDATVNGYDHVGGIVGLAEDDDIDNPTIQNCLYKGSSVTINREIGSVGVIVGFSQANESNPVFKDNFYTWADKPNNVNTDGASFANTLTVSLLSDNVKMNWVDSPCVVDGNTVYLADGAALRMGPYCDNGEGNMPNMSITAVKVNGTALNLSADCLYRHTFNAATENGTTIEVVSENLERLGAGTESQPYEIDNPARWNAFAMSVTNGGNSFAGKFFKMTADVNASTMVGMSSHPFSGNFRGGLGNYTLTLNYGTSSEPFTEEYCAPFRYVSGATIRHLMVGGEIYTQSKHAAGIVAKVIGNSDIIGCRSSVAINSSVNGDGYHGGIVGELGKAVLNITGCRFDGKMLGSSTTSCGGFLGSGDPSDATLKLTGCLFDPEEITVSGGRTFANTTGTLNISNSYYLTTLGEVQGAKPYEVHNYPANLGSTSDEQKYSASDFQVWDNALRFNYNYPAADYYYVSSICLHDGPSGSNAPLLEEFKGQEVSLTLWDRTLYKDGSWNTLCLPFNMDTGELDAQKSTEGSVFYGAELMTLDKSSFNNGELTINFTTSGDIEAGIPYIVRWTTGGNNIVNPVFDGVTVSEKAAATSGTDYVDFIGLYEDTGIYQSGDKTNLYLDADNTLYYPESVSFRVNAFRGYFQLKNGLKASTNTSQGGATGTVRAFHLNFGDESSGINATDSGQRTADSTVWYSVDGRRLTGKPAARGIYISNGKKITIK